MWMDAAKVFISSLQLLVLVLLCLFVTTPAQPSSGRPVRHDYSRRFAQVTRQCQSLLSSATELNVAADRADGQFAQLSFTDGDWSQDAGHAPLFPFHELPEAAVPLVSFRLTEVQVHQRRRAFNASGVLTFSLTCNGGCRPKEPAHGVAKFHIHFEGVYVETPSSSGGGGGGGDSGGERVLCMVGNSALLMRRGSGTGNGSWEDWVKGHEHDGETNIIEPSTTEAGGSGNGNVLLVLRYPKEHTLTTRAVRGEMTSLGSKSDGAYFDTVRMVSRLSPHTSWYTLTREGDEPDAAGCSSNHASFRDGDVVAGHVYRGPAFCEILGKFTSHDYGLLSVVPNWNCSSTDELFCSRPGPFEVSRSGMAFTRSAVTVQDLQCAHAPGSSLDGKPPAAKAKVVAVFRFVTPWEDHPTAAKRTGLSGATLSAEGTWRTSTGRLCMVACLGPGKETCHYRVTLYVPTAFSITRRSIVVGQITAADGSHYPLSFQQGLGHGQERHRFGRSGESVPMAYHYTKITQAHEIMLVQGRASGRFRDSFIARSLLSYPKIDGAADDPVSLSYLAGDLSLDFQPTPKTPPFVPEWIEDPFIEFRILSIGTLVGRYSPAFEDGSSMPVTVEETDSGHGVQKQQTLNVSAVFMAPSNDPAGGQSSVMSLEGMYNPEDGRMFLIGCRNVDAPWRVLTTIRDLEDGMDCSIQVIVEYPPTKNRWMVSRAAKVVVTSTRDDDDPLHFSRTELRTLPSYDHNLGMLPESTQGLLCITMLSTIIAATIGQLRYVDSHGDVAPYVSLAMLGVQALGYSATLVTGARMVPAWPVYTYKMYVDHMDCSVKALTLAALLLTVWLAQKVWVSRALARARSPLEPRRVPRDGAVLLCSFAAHLCCLFFVLAVHWLMSTCGTSATPLSPRETYADGQTPPPNLLCTWGHVVGRYVGVAKEWFLLPQVIVNAAWRVNCKPLTGRYYAGVTMAWLLPHVYGFLWPPYVNVYTEANYDIMHYIYSKSAAVMVPVIGVMLTVLVYVQQRWNYKAVGWVMRTNRNKLPQHDY